MTKSGPTKASSSPFGDAIAAATVAALLTDSARNITAANTAAAELTGYTIDALAGLPLRTLYAAHADWTATDSSLAAAKVRHAPVCMPSTVRKSDGAFIDVALVLTALFDCSGRYSGAIVFMTNGSDAAQSPQTADSDETAIIRFARGAAHDFKNMLAIVTGNIQLAKSEQSSKRRRAFLADAEHASNMAARLANQMIAFARDRAIAPGSISLESLFDNQAAILRAAAGPAITLTFERTDETAAVRADRSGLESALLNLVVNARDAMPNGGTITVSADNMQLTMSGGSQNFVAIRVRDTGTGMTERVRQRAFDPFFSTKPLSHGTGLGLATVMGLARQSGGHAEIASKLGEGTTVTIYLPADISR